MWVTLLPCILDDVTLLTDRRDLLPYFAID